MKRNVQNNPFKKSKHNHHEKVKSIGGQIGIFNLDQFHFVFQSKIINYNKLIVNNELIE